MPTFVVGVGDGAYASELDAAATAGGTALPGGPPVHHQALGAAALDATLETVLGGLVPCDYTLTPTPGDLTFLRVSFDGAAVSRDSTHTDGWDFDATSGRIHFYGAACDELRSASVSSISVVYDCG